MMRDPVEEDHLGIAKDLDPFAELQIGGNDNTGIFIEFADEMKEQRSTRFREWNVAQFINDDAISLAELADNLTDVSLNLFPDQRIYEINRIVEAGFFTLSNKCCSQNTSVSNGDVGFTGSSAADKNQVVGIVCELANI